MNIRWILVGLIFCLIMLPSMASAKNQYYRIDGVYYNDEKLMGDAAKPILKIGEPFTVAVEMTMYQDCKVYIKLTELGTGDFELVNGHSNIGDLDSKIFTKNETYMFEWTLKPTDEWTGGSMPINFHYEIFVKDQYDSLVNSEFTIAVPYITTEYYEGDTTPPTTTEPDSPTSTEEPTTPSTPAFTILTAALAITLAAARRS